MTNILKFKFKYNRLTLVIAFLIIFTLASLLTIDKALADQESYESVYVSQSFGTTVTIGQTFGVTIVMRNNSEGNWVRSEEYKLGSQNPQDNVTWRDGRVALPAAVIGPGETATFRFDATAPSSPGRYNFQWRMLREHVTWFGDSTPNVEINVRECDPAEWYGVPQCSACTSNGTFQAECSDWGSGGPSWTECWHHCEGVPSATCSLTASPSSVSYNNSSTLSWSSTNASSCSASGDWSGSKGTSGSESTNNLTSNSSYTLNCSGEGGSGSCNTSVSVGAPSAAVTISCSPQTIPYNTSANVTWSSTNASSCTIFPTDWTGTSGSQSTGNLTSSQTYTVTCAGF